MECTSRIELIDMGAAEGRAKVAAYEAAKAEWVRCGQQLYAKTKRTSKYYVQGARGALFKVFIEPEAGSYCVQGGPGGQYRLADVYLYVKGDDGRELKIS